MECLITKQAFNEGCYFVRMYEVIEFFNDSKEESNSAGFQKFKNSFLDFSLFFSFSGMLGELSLWRYRSQFLLYRDKIRKIWRIHRKIERGEVCLCTFRGSSFIFETQQRNVIHLWNKINLFFLYEYSPRETKYSTSGTCSNNPEQGRHTSRRMYLHYFHYNGASFAPRYWWLFIHVITLERIKKSFNVEEDLLQISLLNLYSYKMLRFRWFIDISSR